jgi:AbiV family abortive infection protein
MRDRRKFRNTSQQVVAAVQACLQNALELQAAAEEQTAAGRPGLAVSLSVLALEELGKLIFADGLAFSQPGGERARLFEAALKSHKTKLQRLDLFPFAVPYFARIDPRYETEERFRQAIAISLNSTKASRDALARWLGDDWSFEVLDQWKQKGFYAHLSNGSKLTAPNSAIDPELARRLVAFTKVLINFVEFPLRNNFDRYRELLDGVRSKWSEEGYEQLQARVEEGLQELFANDDEP